MTEIDREFIQAKNLSNDKVREAVAAKGPVETVVVDDEGRDTSQTFGVFDAGNGQRFSQKLEEQPLSVKMGLQGFADDDQARDEATKRGFDPETVTADEKGRFRAADPEGNEFFIGRRLRAGEEPQTIGDVDAKGKASDDLEATGAAGEPKPVTPEPVTPDPPTDAPIPEPRPRVPDDFLKNVSRETKAKGVPVLRHGQGATFDPLLDLITVGDDVAPDPETAKNIAALRDKTAPQDWKKVKVQARFEDGTTQEVEAGPAAAALGDRIKSALALMNCLDQ